MKLSVIIPYYNGEQWIACCLDSLLRQDLAPEEYEIIVVDDGSTHSIDTLMSYVERHPNIHDLHQTNQKHAAARNYGLTIAKGDYVFFCDCDDYVADNVFGRLCDIAIGEQADVLLFNVCRSEENETGLVAKRDFDNKASFENGLAYISQPPYGFRIESPILVRRSMMEEEHLCFDPLMFNCEDYLFSLQLMQVAGKVVKVDVDVYYYVQHPSSWVHSAGIANNRNEVINCRFTYIKYLHKTRLELAAGKRVSEGCLDAMSHAEARDTVIYLCNHLQYSSIKENKEYIGELRSLGFYPIAHRIVAYDWIRRLINIYPLWMVLCCMYHLLPLPVRDGIVKAIRKE